MDEIAPQGSTILDKQVKETNTLIPSRVNASFNGMYTKIAEPNSVFGSDRPDDWGFAMIAFSSDAEAADLVLADSDYNWFSVCGELTSRNADYANPYVRYAAPYNEIAAANDVIKAYPADTEDRNAIHQIAQAKAIRAFSYLHLAPYFQFNYQTSADKPCVPIVTEETTDFTNNPRATVAQVYELILSDLNYAVENLADFTRSDKSRIDQKVAYGLRARAYLNMGEWLKAAQDAEKAAEGFTPATMEQISVPSFYQLTEGNWIWGYDMTLDIAKIFPYATSSSWVRSFSGDGYAPATQVYACINNILYDKIPATDVRKGWWIDENCFSPNLDEDQAWFVDYCAYVPYTHVKFAPYANEVYTSTNANDIPLMRIEEMYLIKAEAEGMAGNAAAGAATLEGLIKTYRDPEYTCTAASATELQEEVWHQRRIELWGEGLSWFDIMRLKKPVDRRGGGYPDESMIFNIPYGSDIMLWRIPESEIQANAQIEETDNNPSASLPEGVADFE